MTEDYTWQQFALSYMNNVISRMVPISPEDVAYECCRYADAMMKEIAKREMNNK